MANKIEWIKEKSWKEFQETGLIWFANRILHLFGWVIEYEEDENGVITRAYPARTKFRGFTSDMEDEGFKKVSAYLKHNIRLLAAECDITEAEEEDGEESSS